ncbi:MAG: hypothetical protein MUP58_02505 [Candidatus Nanohaloarchaeota archaeon QJJ-9]|nr:hypothetical protein [Candidatus Nanohaloarchaeota archaeon QJJ-9]
MAFYEQLIMKFQEIGFMDFALPFLLVFAIFYGVLNQIGLFNDDKNLDAVISIVASLIVVGYTPFVEQYFQVYVTNILGGTAIFLLAFLAFYLLAGMALPGESADKWKEIVDPKYVFGVLGLAVAFMFVSYGGPRMLLGPEALEQISGSGVSLGFITMGDVVFFAVIAILIGFMYWTVKGGSSESG